MRNPILIESFVKYQADEGKSKADFTITLNEDVEIKCLNAVTR